MDGLILCTILNTKVTKKYIFVSIHQLNFGSGYPEVRAGGETEPQSSKCTTNLGQDWSLLHTGQCVILDSELLWLPWLYFAQGLFGSWRPGLESI